MNRALAHRGPDADGTWNHGPCALGHRRLSIIDLRPEANQPFLNEDNTLVLVANGEIYNFNDLRAELVQKGHRFRSDSDNEVILHLYEELGPACVARLRGMFAFAVYDCKRQQLLLARDRAGKKPLFYRRLRAGFAFASEVQALISAFPREPPVVDYAALDEFLTLQYVPSPRSAYKNIWKLPAAHYALLTPGREPQIVRYWEKPRGETMTGSEPELALELQRLLREAVRRRLTSDVPLGAFLSGGMDSSSVVALMAATSNRPIKTFSIGFSDADNSDLVHARLVARRYATEHHEMMVSPSMADVVPEIVRHHGEPFADSSAVATWYLSKMTRAHVTVALSGDGGDENFAGYKRYWLARLGHAYDRIPAPLRAPYQHALRAVGRLFAPRLGNFARALSQGEARRYLILAGQFSDADKRGLYLEPLREFHSAATLERFERVLSEGSATSAMGRLADLDWQTYLVDDINVKVDITAMAHSLEVRCPFLDTDVVEFAARLPSRFLMRWRGKYLLRRAMRALVPARIIYRRKRGFGLPLKRWMRRDLRQMIEDVLLDKTARERELFRPSYIEGLVRSLNTPSPEVDRLWTLLVLELWFREFIDHGSAQAASELRTAG